MQAMKVLVLSGGGSRGAWQAGAIKALVESGRRYDLILGTSVGAVNGVAYSILGVDGMLALWGSLRSTKDVMKFNWAWPWKWTGWYSFAPLRKKTIETLKKGQCIVPVHALQTQFGSGEVVAMPISSRDAACIEASADAVIDSCSLPGIHAFTKSMGMDGGLREVAALELAYAMGAKEVDVVLCDSPGQLNANWKPSGAIKLLSIMLRALAIMVNETLREDIEDQYPGMTVYAPGPELKTDPLTYDPKQIVLDIDAGYQAVGSRLAQAR